MLFTVYYEVVRRLCVDVEADSKTEAESKARKWLDLNGEVLDEDIKLLDVESAS